MAVYTALGGETGLRVFAEVQPDIVIVSNLHISNKVAAQ